MVEVKKKDNKLVMAMTAVMILLNMVVVVLTVTPAAVEF